jgi:two-component system chemotaxis response regulator CheB
MPIKLIAIGASTGGFDALEAVLKRLNANAPPVVIVMHLQQGVSSLFVSRLNEMNIRAKEAESGDLLQAGQVLVAPAGKHITVSVRMGRLAVSLHVGAKVQAVMPSVDVLFESVANELKGQAVGVLLTGIGADGAGGMLKMRANGAPTIGQDESTCMVYGMPKVAYEMGAVQYQLPINKIGDKITGLCMGGVTV